MLRAPQNSSTEVLIWEMSCGWVGGVDVWIGGLDNYEPSVVGS